MIDNGKGEIEKEKLKNPSIVSLINKMKKKKEKRFFSLVIYFKYLM